MEQIRDHIPVLLHEMLNLLKPKDDEVYVDCTFGAGGYSQAILKYADSTIYALDLDSNAKAYADKLSTGSNKLYFMQGNFANLPELLGKFEVSSVDAIIADLGVSSMQLDQNERGFSFQKTGPLDMRMSDEGITAYEFINQHSQEELRKVIASYGEESKAKAIARAICYARKINPITSTTQLADIVRSVFKGKRGKIDNATKTFQAIRIWVNKELDNLKKLLDAAKDLLKDGGRLIVISFHSLEDSIVKKFLQEECKAHPSVSRYMPSTSAINIPSFKIITRKAITPSEKELLINVRARSAKLRAAVRINKEVLV